MPTLIGFTYFSRKVEVMSVEMETLVVELINKCYYGRATREHKTAADFDLRRVKRATH